jgi:putative membrane protein
VAVSLWRLAALWTGLALLAAGVAPVWGDGFSGHVVAHLLVGMLGPLLIVAADPLAAWLPRLAPTDRRRVLRWLQHPVLRAVSAPPVIWVLAVLTPWLLWLSPLYPVTERHAVLHAAVHVHFVLAGLLFATVVLGVGPLGRRVAPVAGLLMVAVALPVHALLGLVVLSMNGPLLDGHDTAAALADQRRGAVIMWLAGDLIATAMLAAVFPRWVQSERRRARREDALVQAQLASD